MLQLICFDGRYELFLRVKDYFNSRRDRRCGGWQAERTSAEFFRQSIRNLLVTEIPVTIASLIWAFFARDAYFHFELDVSEERQRIVDVSISSTDYRSFHKLTLIAESFATVLLDVSMELFQIVLNTCYTLMTFFQANRGDVT
ncbi:hypothetical protein pipiens_002029 [Culex pipiens pipiens]|uniref:Uncharacterized protein n=1 Tax=Culex pipiens pipiens TaxID=38569 RepID=A0ABD1DLP8_CULPP